MTPVFHVNFSDPVVGYFRFELDGLSLTGHLFFEILVDPCPLGPVGSIYVADADDVVVLELCLPHGVGSCTDVTSKL